MSDEERAELEAINFPFELPEDMKGDCFAVRHTAHTHHVHCAGRTIKSYCTIAKRYISGLCVLAGPEPIEWDGAFAALEACVAPRKAPVNSEILHVFEA